MTSNSHVSAYSEMVWFSPNRYSQALPQLMPEGLEEMRPPPASPVFVTVSVCFLTKRALTDVSAVMYTLHV